MNSQDQNEEFQRFSHIDLGDTENQITAQYIINYSEAREVFLKGQKWLNEAKIYYNIDNRCSDYVEIIQDSSQLYKLLAFFETEPDRKAKMHRRRVDMLIDLLNKLNQQYYMVVCRQMLFEVGEITNEILDIKVAYVDVFLRVTVAYMLFQSCP